MKKQVFLLVAALIFSQAAFAQINYDFSAVAPSGQTLYYTINYGGITVSVVYPNASFPNWDGYSKPTGNLIIPDSVTHGGISYSVVGISQNTFGFCTGLTSVIIPNSVTQIGYSAFYGCTGLTSVTIPNTVTSIGVGIFYGCTGLSTPVYNSTYFIYMPISYSGSYTIPDGITTICDGAFSQCTGLTSVSIPNSVTQIGGSAFFGCTGLTSVIIPNSVTSIGDYAFSECTGLTFVTISDSITSIKYGVFMNCSGLTSVTIPNSVTNIHCAAFAHCTGLISVVFNADSCTYGYGHTKDGISMFVFQSCPNITSFTFGRNVKLIPDYLCTDMSGLTSMKFLSQIPPQIGTNAFSEIPTDIPVYIPCGRLVYYETQMPQFSNFVEQQIVFSALSADESMGSVQVLTEPSCSNHNAVLYAVPADGYRFDHWSTGSTDNPYTLTVTTDTTVIGYFVLNGGTEGIGEIDEDNIRISVLDGHICVEGITNEELRVYDITGRMVQNRSLPSGVYIVKIGTLPAQKVVVMR